MYPLAGTVSGLDEGKAGSIPACEEDDDKRCMMPGGFACNRIWFPAIVRSAQMVLDSGLLLSLRGRQD